MRPISVALAIADAELREELRAELEALPVRLVLNQPYIESVLLMRLNLDLVLVGCDPAEEPVAHVVHRIKTHSPRSAVAAVSRTPDPELIIEAMQAGADEFLLPPFGQHLRTAVERSAAMRATRPAASSRQPGKVIGFVSAKGGCGATSIACHVASVLERTADADILLADFDLETGSAGFLTQVNGGFSVLDAVRNVHRLDVAFWKRLVCNAAPRLEVLPSPLGSTQEGAPKRDELRAVFRVARSLYGWIIADLGHGLTTLATDLLDDFDELFLVTTPQTPALFHAKQCIQRLLIRGYPRIKLRLILNQVPPRSASVAAEVRQYLGVPVYAEVHHRPELDRCYSEGKLLPPNTAPGAELAALAVKLADLPMIEKVTGWTLFGLRHRPAAGV